MYSVNPIQLVQLIKSGRNPQQLMMGILQQQAADNPIYYNLMTLAKQNRTSEIEQFARNLAKERGVDFDKEFNAFRKFYGL